MYKDEEYLKKWYIKNKEKILKRHKEREKEIKEYNKIYFEKYSLENKDKKMLYDKIYNDKNKDKRRMRSKLYREKNKEQIKKDKSLYYYKNKSSIIKKKRENRKKRLKTDILFRLKNNYLKRIKYGVKRKVKYERNKRIDFLGCSFLELKVYLESKFTEDMSWENYGKYPDGWDIDHIIPTSSAKTEDEIIKLFHYTNLQPLNSYTNRHIKRNKF